MHEHKERERQLHREDRCNEGPEGALGGPVTALANTAWNRQQSTERSRSTLCVNGLTHWQQSERETLATNDEHDKQPNDTAKPSGPDVDETRNVDDTDTLVGGQQPIEQPNLFDDPPLILPDSTHITPSVAGSQYIRPELVRASLAEEGCGGQTNLEMEDVEEDSTSDSKLPTSRQLHVNTRCPTTPMQRVTSYALVSRNICIWYRSWHLLCHVCAVLQILPRFEVL